MVGCLAKISLHFFSRLSSLDFVSYPPSCFVVRRNKYRFFLHLAYCFYFVKPSLITRCSRYRFPRWSMYPHLTALYMCCVLSVISWRLCPMQTWSQCHYLHVLINSGQSVSGWPGACEQSSGREWVSRTPIINHSNELFLCSREALQHWNVKCTFMWREHLRLIECVCVELSLGKI